MTEEERAEDLEKTRLSMGMLPKAIMLAMKKRDKQRGRPKGPYISIDFESIPMLRRSFSNSSSLYYSVIYARAARASSMPLILFLGRYLGHSFVIRQLFRALFGFLRLDCVCDMVNVCVSCRVSFRLACQGWIELSISGNCQGFLVKGFWFDR